MPVCPRVRDVPSKQNRVNNVNVYWVLPKHQALFSDGNHKRAAIYTPVQRSCQEVHSIREPHVNTDKTQLGEKRPEHTTEPAIPPLKTGQKEKGGGNPAYMST